VEKERRVLDSNYDKEEIDEAPECKGKLEGRPHGLSGSHQRGLGKRRYIKEIS